MEKLSKQFNETIISELRKRINKKNVNAVPRIEKLVISTGVGSFKDDDNMISRVSEDLAKITGLKPRINKSKKAVSAFKLRIGQPVGLSVTLRREKMFDFISKLINVALPRVRDFRGLSNKAFDGHGNYTIGIFDQAIFPEVKFEELKTNFGFQINIKTTAKNDKDAKALLEAVGFPFEKKKE